MLIFSLLGTVVSFVMLALAGSLTMLFAARIVDGLSGGNIATARAYIADITTEENRAKAFGLLGAAFGLGFIVGPALGAAFSRISYTAPIWAAAAITIVATAMAFFWLPETVHRAQAGGRSPWRSLANLCESPRSARALHYRFCLLDRLCRVSDDLRVVWCAPVRVRCGAYRVPLERIWFSGGRRAGRAGRTDRPVRWGAANACGGLAVRRGRLGRQRLHPLGAGVCRDARAGRDRHRPVQRDAELADQQVGRRATNRAGCRGRRARSRVSAAPSARCGATARCRDSAKAPPTGRPPPRSSALLRSPWRIGSRPGTTIANASA